MSESQSHRYYWLKLKEDFFDQNEIDWLREQENGSDYCLFYLILCLKLMNNGGKATRQVGIKEIPYTVEKLAQLTHFSIDTVTVALKLLESVGLVQIIENNTFYLTKLEEMIGSETMGALQKRERRFRLKSLANNNISLLSESAEEYSSNKEEIKRTDGGHIEENFLPKDDNFFQASSEKNMEKVGGNKEEIKRTDGGHIEENVLPKDGQGEENVLPKDDNFFQASSENQKRTDGGHAEENVLQKDGQGEENVLQDIRYIDNKIYDHDQCTRARTRVSGDENKSSNNKSDAFDNYTPSSEAAGYYLKFINSFATGKELSIVDDLAQKYTDSRVVKAILWFVSKPSYREIQYPLSYISKCLKKSNPNKYADVIEKCEKSMEEKSNASNKFKSGTRGNIRSYFRSKNEQIDWEKDKELARQFGFIVHD